jgi:hypothetical protein
MAAVVLTILFENVAEDISAVAALKVSTASFGRHRKTNLPLDLEQLAENALIKISHFDRKRPDLAGLLESASLTVDIEDAIKQLPQAFNHEVVGQALKTLANRITKSFAHLSEIVGAADRFFHIQDEELQILSWFLVGRSKLLDCDFSDIKPDEQPLIFATELAELVSYMPGPLAVRSILARVGLKERKKLSVPQVINAANAEMMTKIMENVVPSPITQPMHFAISRKLETGDEESWVSNWAAVTGIDAKSTLSPLEVAVLFYRERLLNRG